VDAEQDRLASILAKLPMADAAFLDERLRPAWRRRARRLDGRDEAIRAAAAFFPDDRPTVVAKALATHLDRYLAAAWRPDRELADLPDDVPRLRAALHRLAVANEGRSLGWRQIWNVLSGSRS
jgi:hypothetical protein